MREIGLFIDGGFRPAADGRTFETREAAGGAVLARVASAAAAAGGAAGAAARRAPGGGGGGGGAPAAAGGGFLAGVASPPAAEVDAAGPGARRALGAWGARGNAARAAALTAVADAVASAREELATLETRDTGRVIAETRFDADAVADLFRYFAGVVRSEEEHLQRHDADTFSMIVRRPLGVVGAIVPWNFPLLIGAWKIAPALAAGNTIVLKPATLAPLSLLHLAEITAPVLPPGLLNVLPGSGSRCGAALVDHPLVAKLTFTGSTAVGRTVAQSAGQRVVPVTMELGGKSANIVFEDADLERAAEGAVMAIMMSQGQVCSAGSRLLVQESIHDDFVARVVEICRSIRMGNPLDDQTRMGPLIDRDQFEAVSRYIDVGRAEGAVVACGGTRRGGAAFENGYYLEPTVLTNTTPAMRVVREEIFGPVLVVQRFRTEAEAIALANDSDYGLGGAVWTRHINRALRVAQAVHTGTMWVNDYHPVPSGSPFGGFKQSGFGREAHKSAIDAYSQLQTIFVSTSETPYGWYR